MNLSFSYSFKRLITLLKYYLYKKVLNSCTLIPEVYEHKNWLSYTEAWTTSYHLSSLYKYNFELIYFKEFILFIYATWLIEILSIFLIICPLTFFSKSYKIYKSSSFYCIFIANLLANTLINVLLILLDVNFYSFYIGFILLLSIVEKSKV